MSILVRLRAETREEHAGAEQAVDLADSLRSVDDYADLLRRFYGFYAPLERQLAEVQAYRRTGLGDDRIGKAAHLRKDLTALGFSDPDDDGVELCRDLPAAYDAAALWGRLYVVEGATLGGRIITREVFKSLGFTPAAGASFFAGYGPLTSANWQAFCTAMLRFAGDVPTVHDEIVAAAKQTFTLFRNWMSCRRRSRPLRPST